MRLPAPRGGASATWSICVLEAGTGAELAAWQPDHVLATASVAKLFALVELAARLEQGLDPTTMLDRRDVALVGDSGVWQHLDVERLAVTDVAALVGATSDNLATNVLLDLLGLERVQATAAGLAPGGSMLHDVVRDERTGADPPTLSSGCARDWARLFAALDRREVVSAEVSRRVLDWTALNADLSMVAAAFGLDPLSHAAPDDGIRLWSKTGTDIGVRCEVGLVTRGDARVAYAVLCTWEDQHGPVARQHVLHTMREVGSQILAHLEEHG